MEAERDRGSQTGAADTEPENRQVGYQRQTQDGSRETALSSQGELGRRRDEQGGSSQKGWGQGIRRGGVRRRPGPRGRPDSRLRVHLTCPRALGCRSPSPSHSGTPSRSTCRVGLQGFGSRKEAQGGGTGVLSCSLGQRKELGLLKERPGVRAMG